MWLCHRVVLKVRYAGALKRIFDAPNKTNRVADHFSDIADEADDGDEGKGTNTGGGAPAGGSRPEPLRRTEAISE